MRRSPSNPRNQIVGQGPRPARSQLYVVSQPIESKGSHPKSTPETVDTCYILSSEGITTLMETTIHRNPTDSDTISTLLPAQAQVVTALAQGQSVTAAAKQAGVHRDTIYQWLKSQLEFKTAVENARTEYVAVLSDGMRDLAARAIETLKELLDDPKTPAAVRLRTALAILQRPQFPEPGWRLPERIESPREQQVVDGLAEIKADYTAMRMTDAMDASAQKKKPSEAPQ